MGCNEASKLPKGNAPILAPKLAFPLPDLPRFVSVPCVVGPQRSKQSSGLGPRPNGSQMGEVFSQDRCPRGILAGPANGGSWFGRRPQDKPLSIVLSPTGLP